MKRRHQVRVSRPDAAFTRKFWTVKRAGAFFAIWESLVDKQNEVAVRYVYTFKASQRT